MSGLSTCDWRGTTSLHEAAVIYMSPACRQRSCPVTYRKLSSFIKAPKPEIQLASAAHYQPAVPHPTKELCKRITLRKQTCLIYISWLYIYISQVIHFSRHSVFKPCKVLLSSLGLTSLTLFAVCNLPLCRSGCSLTQNTLCFTMWGNKPNWDAVLCTSGILSGATAIGLWASKWESQTPLASNIIGGSMTSTNPCEPRLAAAIVGLKKPQEEDEEETKETESKYQDQNWHFWFRALNSGSISHNNCFVLWAFFVCK